MGAVGGDRLLVVSPSTSGEAMQFTTTNPRENATCTCTKTSYEHSDNRSMGWEVADRVGGYNVLDGMRSSPMPPCQSSQKEEG